ncbi:Poly [ADP-ribose] polymerase 2, partial [Podochytrium sp. JEL0797]
MAPKRKSPVSPPPPVAPRRSARGAASAAVAVPVVPSALPAKKPKAAPKTKVIPASPAPASVSPPPQKKPRAKKPPVQAPPPIDPESDKDEPPAKKPRAKKQATVPPPPPPPPLDVESESEKEEEEAPVVVTQIKKGAAAVDSGAPAYISREYHVLHKDGVVYDALLNQTNIGNNNNKFYIIQVLKHDSTNQYITWNRWGRVGNNGQSAEPKFPDADSAISAFERKFMDKTKNHWANRDNFVKHTGKYFLLERDFGEDDDAAAAEDSSAAKPEEPIQYPDSKLAEPVQDLMKLIFNLDLMDQAMSEIGYDSKKMPLGKLTKKTIQKGYLELKKISEELNRVGGPRFRELQELSGDFYTIIPHNFGMRKPDVIGTPAKLAEKLRMVE